MIESHFTQIYQVFKIKPTTQKLYLFNGLPWLYTKNPSVYIIPSNGKVYLTDLHLNI